MPSDLHTLMLKKQWFSATVWINAYAYLHNMKVVRRDIALSSKYHNYLLWYKLCFCFSTTLNLYNRRFSAIVF